MLINKFLEFHFYTDLIILTRWQLPDEIYQWFLHSRSVNWIFVNKFWKTFHNLKKGHIMFFFCVELLREFGWRELSVMRVLGSFVAISFPPFIQTVSQSQTSQLEELSPLWSTITIPNWQSWRGEPCQEENRWLRWARSGMMKIVLVRRKIFSKVFQSRHGL